MPRRLITAPPPSRISGGGWALAGLGAGPCELRSGAMSRWKIQRRPCRAFGLLLLVILSVLVLRR